MSKASRSANRVNALKSTGPDDKSRTRFNGLAHGLTSKQTVIPGEDQVEYDAFHANMLSDTKPGSTIETVLVERLIAAAWRLKRFNHVESAFFNNRIEAYLEEHPQSDPDTALGSLFADPAEAARMRLFLRDQTCVQKEYDTTVRELQTAKAQRARAEYDRDALVCALPEKQPQPAVEPAIGFASQTASEPPAAQQNLLANAA